MNKIQELRQKRAKLITDARRDLVDKATKEKRDLTAEERGKFDELMKEADELQREIDVLEADEKRMKQLAEAEAGLARATSEPVRPQPSGGEERSTLPLYNEDGERRELTDQEDAQRRALAGYLGAANGHEARNLEAGLDTQGGFVTVPQVVAQEMLRTVDDLNFIRGISRVTRLDRAESLGIPEITKPSAADWTSELLTGAEDTTLGFGKREIRPHPLAKRIRVSLKLVRSASQDPVAIVNREFGIVFANTEEQAFMTGDGEQKPLGVFVASSDGISTSRDVADDNTTTEIQPDNLLRVKYTLKSQYWAGANWIMHRDVVSQVARLKDGNGRYLFDVERNLLMGFPLRVSERAPNTLTTGNYVAILGNFNAGYWIVDALDMTLQRLDELYAATNQVGFIARRETDGAPVLEEAFVRSKLA